MRLRNLAVSVAVFLFADIAHAQTTYGNYANEYAKLVSQASDVSLLDEHLFGDQVSLYTGALSFEQTDVSLPGAGYPMAITRSFRAEERSGNLVWGNAPFGDWDLDLPRLHGVFAVSAGWDTQYNGSNRCSGPLDADSALPSTVSGASNIGFFDGIEYWQGTQLSLPGSGNQELMLVSSANPNKPSDGPTYRWVTNSQWFLSCLPTTANSQAGDAFLARGPDGTRIWFDHLATRTAPELRKKAGTGGPTFSAGAKDAAGTDAASQPSPSIAPGGDTWILPRQEVSLWPTRIQDRFGNAITFAYAANVPGRLVSMQASDGRTLALTYNANGKVQTVSDGTRTWTYIYDTAGSLAQVTLPDASAWTFSLGNLARYTPLPSDSTLADVCNNQPTGGSGNVVGTLTHPSGAVGSFTLTALRHARSYVDKLCVQDSVGITPAAFHARNPKLFTTPTLVSKQISGPGLPTPALWTFTYDSTNSGSWASSCASGCPGTTWTQVRTPGGAQVLYTFGNHYRSDEGKLYRTQTSQVSTVGGVETVTLLRDEQTTFVASASGQPYPAAVGLITHQRGDGMAALLQPVQQSALIQQGVNLVRSNNSFDAFANPTSVTRSSSGLSGPQSGYSRVELITYAHDLTQWVLGQVASVTVGGTVVASTVYDSAVLPKQVYSVGVLQAALTYDASGALATVTDGRGSVTQLGSWYRGVPRLITFPAAPTVTTMSAVVSPIGLIIEAVDQVGAKNCYGYDALGRLNLSTYNSEVANSTLCDTTSWTATTRSFVKIAVAEYGLPAGHWRQTVQTGNGKATTFYDARWSPVLSLREDTGNAATRSFTVNRYDAAGRLVYTSYPVATLTSVNDALPGARTSYDALGRVTQVQQDNAATPATAVLNTDTSYLSGFRTQVTNPRGFATITNYQVFDTPSTDAPLGIALPEGAYTTITRDVFGKPKTISRSGIYGGGTIGATRYYVYDANERLCQTINPESGTTIVDYDAAGNLAWSAEAQTASGLTAASCAADRVATAVSARSTRTLDAMNRVTYLATPGSVADVTTTYAPDGRISTLLARQPGTDTVNNTYTYNRRRLLTREQLQVNTLLPWNFDYAYNANGHLNSQTYPGALVVGYAPDALGRPTQAGTFASNVTYYPNGAISGFAYGNGIVHTMTQNDRRLPARSLDAFGATKVLDDTYSYDANGNVLSMADAAGTGLNDRTWGVAAPTLYDGLDRLLSVRGTNWGTLTGSYNALYSYDPLDNFRSAKIGASGYTHAYDLGTPSNTNRLVSMQLNGSTTYALGTDAAGNITSDARTSHGYQFDVAHRLTAVTGPGAESYLYDGNGRRARTLNSTTGTIEYFGYGADGRLLADWSNRRQVRNQYVYLGNTLVGLNELNITTFAVATLYKHTDALGSPVATTDAGKNVTGRQAYSPYGIPMAPVDGVGYTGHVMDVGTGLTYMQQRYYDPGIGRFLSVDPMVSDMSNGWNFNRYNYAANNPYKFKDPDGRIIDIVLDVGFIIYDVVQIARTGATATNMAALGADVVGAIIPGATGLGAGVRAAAHADDAYKGSKLARNMAEAGNGVKKGVEEAHHIVAKGDRRAEGSREILKRNGLDVHGADNGAAMSKAEHRGVHTSEMHATVESRFQSAEARGTSPASRANEVKCELACMRNELESSGRLE